MVLSMTAGGYMLVKTWHIMEMLLLQLLVIFSNFL